MSFSSTTNYALQKPDIGTEIDSWGDELNGNWDIVSTQMKLNADAAAAATTALAGKAPTVHTHVMANITDLAAALALKAPLAAPALTGVPTAPTAAAATNTTQLATTAFVTAAIAAIPGAVGGAINNKTSSYGLVLADAGDLIEMNVASANTVTVPLNSTQAFPPGTRIDVVQMGAGQTTLVATGGVTLRSSGAKLKLTAQYSGVTLMKRGTDDWFAWGDLSA